MDIKSKIEAESALRDFITWAQQAYKEKGDAYFTYLKDKLEDIAPAETTIEYTVQFESNWSAPFTFLAAGDDELKSGLRKWAEASLSAPNRVVCFLLSGQFFLLQAGVKNGVKFVSEAQAAFLGLQNVAPPIFVRKS